MNGVMRAEDEEDEDEDETSIHRINEKQDKFLLKQIMDMLG